VERDEEDRRLRQSAQRPEFIDAEKFLKLMHATSEGGREKIIEFFARSDFIYRAAHHDWEQCEIIGCEAIYKVWKELL